jgi:putative phosphonate metabolism protein
MQPDSSPYRVAIYYAPDTHSNAWQMGSTWLGRNSATGQQLPQPAVQGIATDVFSELTSHPRRYGWHATLKAPFQLAPGHTLSTLRAGVLRLCQGRKPFDLAPWDFSTLDGFLSLRPKLLSRELNQLAADCVQQLHNLAAPLSEIELARRRSASLTPGEDALLVAWGYPYVLQHFQFHLSLTGPLNALSPKLLPALMLAAKQHFLELPVCRVDRLSVFIEPESGEDFQLLEQIEFTP